MNALTTRSSSTRATPVAGCRRALDVLRSVGRFTAHLAERCMAMCAGAVVLSVTFFGTAALLGYTDLPETAPGLSVFVIAVNLSVPMLVWMRFRGMDWRPTLEMSGATMLMGVALIAAYWFDLIGKESLVETETGLACPVMVAVMLLRFRLYSAGHSAHSHRGAPAT